MNNLQTVSIAAAFLIDIVTGLVMVSFIREAKSILRISPASGGKERAVMANLTKKTIMRTFTQMLEEIPFDKITVTALSKRAGISHNTFYYNYQDIYALLDAWFTEELGKYTPSRNDGNWQAILKNFLLACKERRKLIYHIFYGISRDNLERYAFSATDYVFLPYVRKMAEGKNASEKHLRDVANFCRYAFMGFFLEYLWNNMDCDEEELSERIYRMLSGFVTSSMENIPN